MCEIASCSCLFRFTYPVILLIDTNTTNLLSAQPLVKRILELTTLAPLEYMYCKSYEDTK